jgi:hypothetical protein
MHPHQTSPRAPRPRHPPSHPASSGTKLPSMVINIPLFQNDLAISPPQHSPFADTCPP